MIAVKKIIELFQRMNREHWSYEWGAAREGCVDCSGAYVYAYRVLDGHKIGIHGSNYIARKECGRMLPISEAKPGMAAFKRRVPGDGKYALPGRYKQGGAYYNGDLNDYYHIGLVDDDVNYVLNAQSTQTGFRRSPISQNWCGVAYLDNVKYDGGVEPMEKLHDAIVVAEKGGSVRMRKLPDKSGEVICTVPLGTVVPVYENAAGWSHIEYNGTAGYMMEEFLKRIDDDSTDTGGNTDGDADCSVDKRLLEIDAKLDRVLYLLGDKEDEEDNPDEGNPDEEGDG